MSSLRGALPLPHHGGLEAHGKPHYFGGASPADFEDSFKAPAQQPRQASKGLHAWSSDFLTDAPMSASASQQYQQYQQQSPLRASARMISGPLAGVSGYGLQQPHFGSSMSKIGSYAPNLLQRQHMSLASSSHTGQAAQQGQDQVDDTVWIEAFTAFDEKGEQGVESMPPPLLIDESTIERADMTVAEADELARTAGKLVSTVEHDQNDKFKQSNFLNLMRKFRDREAGIQGRDIFETSKSASRASSVSLMEKGQGQAMDADMPYQLPPRSQQEAFSRAHARSQGRTGLQLSDSMLQSIHQQAGQGQEWLNELWSEEDQRSDAIEEKVRLDAARRQAFVGDGGDLEARKQEDDLEAKEFAKYHDLGTNVFGANSRLQPGWEEQDESQAHEEDYSHEDFVGRRWEGQKGRGRADDAQVREWDKLQADWDSFEAGPHGLHLAQTPQAFAAANVPRYQFQPGNPYLETTRHHMAHALKTVPEDVRTILEAEAAVQVDPTDSAGWYILGVKQQENERERLAIAALHRAIQINPLMKDAWLALAVSYTNESDRRATFESLERWIDSNERYAGVVAAHRAKSDDKGKLSHVDLPYHERHSRVVSTLLVMARHGSQYHGEVDADVQVALGILFNASDDFAKAVDCFSAAISVRPEDWLLYNRLGAVLSNSGRSDEALHYYRYALELKPDFARCHFNLAISCLNLQRYADAAIHSYTALALQDSHAQQQQTHLRYGSEDGSGVVGTDGNNSLWETLRVSLELMNRPELAQRTYKRDISLLEPSELAPPGGGSEDDGGGGDCERDGDNNGGGAVDVSGVTEPSH